MNFETESENTPWTPGMTFVASMQLPLQIYFMFSFLFQIVKHVL